MRRVDPRQGLQVAQAWLREVVPGSEGEAWAVRACALGFTESGAVAAALDAYERAEQLFEGVGLPVEVARTGLGHVWALRLRGDYDEAVRLALRTRRVLREHGESYEAARQTLNLGTVYRRQGKLQAARRAYLDVARAARRQGDISQEATCVSNLGNVLGDLGQYGEAEWALRRAARLYAQLNFTAQAARVQLSLGLILKRRGDYGRALTALQESRALYEQLDLRSGVVEADLFLAQAYLSLNLLREAADSAQRAVEGFSRLGMPYELGQALVWSAAVAARQDEPAEAAARLAEAVRLFRQIGNVLWEANTILQQAGVAEPNEARLAEVAEAERRLARIQARDRVVEARLVQGDLARRLGRDREALGHYRAASRGLQSLADGYLAYRGSAALGRVLETSRPAQALVHYEAAMEQLERLRSRARADDLKVSFVSDKLDVYERTVGLLLTRRGGERRAAQALAVVERGRSLGLLDDLLAQAEHGGRSAAAQVRRLSDLRTRLSHAYAEHDEARGEWPSQRLAALKRLEHEVLTRTRELQLAVRGEVASAPFDLDRLRAALPPEAVLVEYYSLGQELVCFLVSRERLRLIRGLGSVADAQRLAGRLRFQLGKGVFGASYLEQNLPRLRRDLDRVLRELWQLALAPIASDLRDARRIIVVPHGPLHGLPFHAAHDGSTYLLDRALVSYAPSARVFSACAERPTQELRRPLFVAPNDDSLPWLVREVKGLTNLFPEGEALVGRRASVDGLRRRAGQFDLLHIAAHGTFRADNPHLSAIRLANGWLGVADLAEVCRGASLVTLSACETGLNSVTAGEELVGITRAVLGAGAASLVASFWTVHDEATSHLMAEFYGALASGRSKAESLRLAMLTMRREIDYPLVWAPFALAGAS